MAHEMMSLSDLTFPQKIIEKPRTNHRKKTNRDGLPKGDMGYRGIQQESAVAGIENHQQQKRAAYPSPIGFPFEPMQIFGDFGGAHQKFFNMIKTTAVNHPQFADMAFFPGLFVKFQGPIQPHEKNRSADPSHGDGDMQPSS